MLKIEVMIIFYNFKDEKNKKCLNLISIIFEIMQINPNL